MAGRRINLLPPELAEKRKSRQRMATLGVAALVLIGLLAIVFISQEIRVRAEQSRLDDQEAINAGLRSELAGLRAFDQLEQELDRKERLLQTLTAQEVRWSVVLADLSLVIPENVWLTDMTASVNLNAPEGSPIGTVTMSGTTFTHPDVARWLNRLERIDAFTNPYLSLSASNEIETIEVVDFTSSSELSEAAYRRNQAGARRAL